MISTSRTPQKPSILLLTGFLYNKCIWQPLCQKLQHDFDCYRWDGRAIDSNCLERLSLNLVSSLPEKFYVCGWSMGGLLALYLAHRFPNRIKGMLLIATNPCFIEQQGWPGVQEHHLKSLLNEFKNNPERARQAFCRLQAHGLENDRDKLERYLLPTCSSDALDVVFKQILTLNLLATLNTLYMPIEYIFFKKDKLVPWQVSHHIDRYQFKSTKTSVIANTGHGGLITNYDFIADRLRRML